MLEQQERVKNHVKIPGKHICENNDNNDDRVIKTITAYTITIPITTSATIPVPITIAKSNTSTKNDNDEDNYYDVSISVLSEKLMLNSGIRI